MQTLDPVESTPEGAVSSPAARRNTQAILAVLKTHLPPRGRLLEVASGSGQHAVAFADAFPDMVWTPSDPSADARASIAAWREQAALANLEPPLALDVRDETTWPAGLFDAVFCANMIHISPWNATEGMMRLAGERLGQAGLLLLYGPFLEVETPLAPSNAAFDASLRGRDAAWGLRDRDAVTAAAKANGLALTRRVAMPANNLMLLFRRL